MGRDKLVTGRFTQLHADYFDELAAKGYGTGRVEVIEYLVLRALDDLMRSGVIRLHSTAKGTGAK